MAKIKDLKRMCVSHEGCEECPFFCNCSSPDSFLDNADEIVEKWVEEHPVKTYMQDFYEKFPKAYKESDRPTVCRALIYGEEPNCFKIDCKKCWDQFMRGE